MAAKLKDGLFLGDFETAQDMEFIMANKITRVINCAGREVGNAWERCAAHVLHGCLPGLTLSLRGVRSSGIRYLTYTWPESGNCIIFDDSNTVLDEIFGVIEEGVCVCV